MTQQAFRFLGIAAGLGGAMAASRLARRRRLIDLAGRVVVITGGSRGLGLELARAFSEQGARLALVSRDEEALHRAQDDLAGRGARVFISPADIRDRAGVERAIARIVTHYGRIDVLVNNAGVITVGPIEHMTIEDYEQAMAVHYWGPLYASFAALPHLRRSRAARIVNIGSIGGKIAVPHLAAYSGSKFALAGFSDALRAELARDGIRVTTVCPGLIRTGSPINVTFKGHREAEYTWFSVCDSLPVLSISAERAARQIVHACRMGAPSLVIGAPARLAMMAQALAPGFVAAAMAVAARLLPPPEPAHGSEPRMGRELPQGKLRSVLSSLGNAAARRNNELRTALPIAAGRS